MTNHDAGEIAEKVMALGTIRLLPVRLSQDGCLNVFDLSEPHDPEELRPCYLPKYEHGETEDIFWVAVPDYFTDPTADYAVLVRVRETWNEAERRKFHAELMAIYDQRPSILPDCTEHLVGDWSRAALAVVRGRDENP